MTKKIMIVDDDPNILITVKNGLEETNNEFEVICAESGAQCFELLKNNQIPNLILLDIMMPEMNGWEVLNRLRENRNWNNIPIVFLTAKTDDFSKTFGSSLAMDYIEKPFEIGQLKHRIDNVLKKLNQKIF